MLNSSTASPMRKQVSAASIHNAGRSLSLSAILHDNCVFGSKVICVKNLHSKVQFVNFLCYCCLKAHWSALVGLFTRGWSIPLFLKACFVSLLIGLAGWA